jgi:hypothetical protein
LAKRIWLSLTDTVDVFADRMDVGLESDEVGANAGAQAEVLASLADEALAAEGLAVDREPPEFERIPAAWWAMAIPEGLGYAERGRATFNQIGVTVVNFRQSAICRMIAPGTIAGYRRVRVSAEAVERLWPPSSPIVPTGTVGRPSKSKHLIEDEFNRRVEAREASPLSLADEARRLWEWLKMSYPEAERPTPKVIENNIRAGHRRYKIAMKLPP